MSVFRTNNPAEFDDIDGIIIDESAPPSSIQGAQTGTVILVGQFASGPLDMREIASVGELYELYSKNTTYSGIKALQNKKFGRLKIIRVASANADKATLTVDDGAGTPVSTIKFDAKWAGAYGNFIQVKIEAGSSSGKKYTIKDTRTVAVLPQEVYDNVAIADAATSMAASRLVDVTVLDDNQEPENGAFTALAGGADDTVADTDYQAAIALAGVEGAGNILFLDAYNTTRNGYLVTHAADTQDKVVIISLPESTTTATAVTAALTEVALRRDTEGRVIYAFNEPSTVINSVSEYTSPAAWLASILSQTHPSIDPAFAKNVQFMVGASGLKHALTRAQFIQLKEAGICAFELDTDLGIKPKSGVVTQIADTSKLTISRRRMADYLTTSAARFLKNYQNAPNTRGNRDAVKAAILNFVGAEERAGTLPKDAELKTGKAKLVDTESLNTDTSIGQGYFYVLWKQRIYSSMRYIVVQAQIGETVVVTEQQ